MSARSSGSVQPRACVASIGRLGVHDVEHGEHVERGERGGHPFGVGERAERVAAVDDQRPDLAPFDLVDERRARVLTHARRQVGTTRRRRVAHDASPERARPAAVVTADEAGVEPHPARAVVGTLDDVQGPGEPLGHVGGDAHRDAGARLRGDALVATQRVEEVVDVGSRARPVRSITIARSNGATAARRRSTPEACSSRNVSIGTVVEELADEVGEQHPVGVRLSAAGSREASLAVSVRRGSMTQTSRSPAARSRNLVTGSGKALKWPWLTTGLTPMKIDKVARSRSTAGSRSERPAMSSATSGLHGESRVTAEKRLRVARPSREPRAVARADRVEGGGRRHVDGDGIRSRARRAPLRRRVPRDRPRQASQSTGASAPDASRISALSRRFGWWCSAPSERPLGQEYPRDTGSSMSPRAATTRGPSIETTSAHAALQMRQNVRCSETIPHGMAATALGVEADPATGN